MTQKANLDIVLEILQKANEPVTFEELWEEVNKQKKYSEEEVGKRMSQLYTNMSLDGRFVNVRDNTWDLRDRVTFADVHLSMYDFYTEDTEDDEDDIELDFDDDGEQIRLRTASKRASLDDDEDEDEHREDAEAEDEE
jgi:DNA-directed RNA polymerase subunit delta